MNLFVVAKAQNILITFLGDIQVFAADGIKIAGCLVFIKSTSHIGCAASHFNFTAHCVVPAETALSSPAKTGGAEQTPVVCVSTHSEKALEHCAVDAATRTR